MQDIVYASYMGATGDIQYNMTNDHMFHYILQKIFSSKFKLSVVELNHIELATDEDKAFQIDFWARLFKAKTWEELKMVAEKSEYLNEAAKSVYVANADEIVRQKCLAREAAERHERTVKRNIKRMTKQIASLTEENTSLKDDNAALKDDNAALKDDIARLRARIAELEAQKNN